jgi:hypothetical protein
VAEFTQPLHLVSPVEKSKRAKDAQWLLAGNNVFKQDFHPGKVDGQFGPGSAAAVRNAKYMLGYPKKSVDESFGQEIYEYLTGKKELPAALAKARVTRLKELDSGGAKSKAVDAALLDAKNHVTETPTNLTPFGEWYGYNGVAWCCIYVTYRLVEAGFKGFEKGVFSKYCGDVVNAARNRQRQLGVTMEPERGDLVIYNGDEHIEFFLEWVEKGRSFRAVGGNTSASDGSPSNGGAVAVNTRYTTGKFRATSFVRVGA